MLRVMSLMVAVVLSAGAALAQTKVTVDDLSHHPFQTDFPSGGELTLLIRSAEIHIVGSDASKLGVTVSGREASGATDIWARFKRSGDSGELRVRGGPHNDTTITVTVPKNSNLYVRVFAGDMDVKGITGNKDVELHAGDLRIAVGNPGDYARVQASVTAGDIDASPFGESHGGLFRSFAKSGTGKYKLLVHVGAGDLTLE
jgi:hypothetical protein